MSLRTILLFTIACAGIAQAAEITLNVGDAASYAIKHNPALSAARLRIEEARGRLNASGRRSNPELEIGVSQSLRSAEHGVGVALMQKFPRTQRLRLEKAVSRAELAAAEAEVRDAERKIAGEARAAAVKLLALERIRDLRGQQISNSEELSTFLGKRVQTGEASAVDAAQVELETRQLSTQILQSGVESAVLLSEIRPLLGLRATDTLKIAGTLASPGSLPTKGVSPSDRADYRAAQSTADAAQHGVELAKANKWEDFTAGLTFENGVTEDAPEGLERESMVGIKFSLPLPFWNKNEGQIQEAIARAERSRKEVAALAMQISAEAAGARMEMAALGKIVADIDDKLIPQAKQIEEQLRTNYQAGLVPLPEVIRARGRRFELETQRLDAVRDWNLAKARHATATGAAGTTRK